MLLFCTIMIMFLLVFVSYQLNQILVELRITNKQHEGDLPWYTLLSEDGKSVAQIAQETGVRIEDLIRHLKTESVRNRQEDLHDRSTQN